MRASVSVLVRVPYSPPRRSGRGGTSGLRIFSHQGRGLHFPDQPSARLLAPGARLRGLWAWGRLNSTFQFPALIKKKEAKRRPSLPAHGPSQTHHHRCLLWRNRLKPPPLPRGPPTRAWSQAMSAHVAAGGGDLRPSLRARASGKQIAPHEGSKQSSRPGRGPSQRSRRRGWQPCMYLPCGPLPTLQAKKSRIKSVKAALLVPRPSRVGEEQRGFGTFRNR